MAIMHWGSYLETGHKELDKQHRDLVARINQLDPSVTGDEYRIIVMLLISVSGYTKFHFKLEESLMDQSNYPEATSHKAMHRSFEAELDAMIEAFKKNTPDASSNIVDLLQDWNPKHIITEDQKLVDHLISNLRTSE